MLIGSDGLRMGFQVVSARLAAVYLMQFIHDARQCSHGCLASAHLVGRSLTHKHTDTRSFYCCFHQPRLPASCGSSQSERGSLLNWKSYTANEGLECKYNELVERDWDGGCENEYEGEERSDRVFCLLLMRILVYSGLETLLLKLFIYLVLNENNNKRITYLLYNCLKKRKGTSWNF